MLKLWMAFFSWWALWCWEISVCKTSWITIGLSRTCKEIGAIHQNIRLLVWTFGTRNFPFLVRFDPYRGILVQDFLKRKFWNWRHWDLTLLHIGPAAVCGSACRRKSSESKKTYGFSDILPQTTFYMFWHCHEKLQSWNTLVHTNVDVEVQGNDVATVLDSGDRLGRTPLHYAASQKTGPNCLKRGGGQVPSQGETQMGVVNLPNSLNFYI